MAPDVTREGSGNLNRSLALTRKTLRWLVSKLVIENLLWVFFILIFMPSLTVTAAALHLATLGGFCAVAFGLLGVVNITAPAWCWMLLASRHRGVGSMEELFLTYRVRATLLGFALVPSAVAAGAVVAGLVSRRSGIACIS